MFRADVKEKSIVSFYRILTYLINESQFDVTRSIIENGVIRVSTVKAVSTVTRLFKDDSFTLHTALYIYGVRERRNGCPLTTGWRLTRCSARFFFRA